MVRSACRGDVDEDDGEVSEAGEEEADAEEEEDAHDGESSTLRGATADAAKLWCLEEHETNEAGVFGSSKPACHMHTPYAHGQERKKESDKDVAKSTNDIAVWICTHTHLENV